GLCKSARRGQASHPVLVAFNPESAAVDGEEPGLRVGSPEYPAPAGFYGEVTLFNSLHVKGKVTVPVGFIYFQLPGKKEPAEMFVGDWENISGAFAGVFFRAEGGNASLFEFGVQGDMIKSHVHAIQSQQYKVGGKKHGFTWDNGKDDSNNSDASGGVETRPINITIRIWERVS
ncbi:hypothetical protein, partial [Treponema endosymbiont of Eucomonympha sp.]|uniref:hypothetical protein n=1 Tax=Treponema endosymbiont of Eucomonympha sp. TaxID=1580831 RepID=UPI000B30BDBE